MCGIVGYVGTSESWPIVFAGLQRLGYRGYDSAGIAVIGPDGSLQIRKSAGKVQELEPAPGETAPVGTTGIGHTRWATHGAPNSSNAHPHSDCAGDIALVHNGIVENYLELKLKLTALGHRFTSDTDTEVIVHLLEDEIAHGLSFEAALLHVAGKMRGANAIGALRRDEPDKLLALKRGHAGGLVVASRQGEAMFASDLPALVPFSSEVWPLDDGELAVVTPGKVKVVNRGGSTVVKAPLKVPPNSAWVDKDGHDHFMLKEILEQPQAISSALRGRVDFERSLVTLDDFPLSDAEIRELSRVMLVGCGTSLNAGMLGAHLIEEFAGIPATAESSSELRYRSPVIDERTLVVAIGQSGETADTLAAMQDVRQRGARLLTICNVEGSLATRLAEGTLHMRSGVEVGVASTKTFVASLTLLSLLAAYLGQARGASMAVDVVGQLARAPGLMGGVLAQKSLFREMARKYARYDHFLYLGRSLDYPIAVEGALKLKEISYIHAEAYPAGEMKHGPIALIDERMPVVAIATAGPLYDKMVGNIMEVKARGGSVIAVATEGDPDLGSLVDDIIYLPQCEGVLSPLLSVLPLQLLAYHIALRRGCDVDQPRNLAKTVTVE